MDTIIASDGFYLGVPGLHTAGDTAHVDETTGEVTSVTSSSIQPTHDAPEHLVTDTNAVQGETTALVSATE